MCISSAYYTHPEHLDYAPDPVECVMDFIYKGEMYRVYGEWYGDDWDGTAKAYLLDEDGDEQTEVNALQFWQAAAEAMAKNTYEHLENV